MMFGEYFQEIYEEERKKKVKRGVRHKIMKILSLLVILLAFFRETRHQFPIIYPHFTLSLANEEFIDPVVPVIEPSAKPLEREDPTLTSATPVNDNIEPLKPHSNVRQDQESLSKSQQNDGSQQPQIYSSDDAILTPPVTAFVPPIFPQGSQNVPPVEESRGDELTPTAEQKVADNNVIEGTPQIEESSSLTNGSQTQQQQPPGPIVLDGQKKGNDKDEPIPSYMEYIQKKQQELIINTGQNGNSGSPGGNGNSNNQNGQNGHSTQSVRNTSVLASVASGIDAKNFASPDCGAKVVQSNQGSQNPSGVLSSSHDEYMLNRCGTNIWFVVELCEPLTIERISVGNLELFSSSPKEVEFGISDRYPTRDWVKLGPFTLPDARAIHPVVLPPTNASTFGKFVKVTVHSHYGSEHYCPVSVIRVNGKSEYEVLESETTHQEDVDKEEGALFEEPIEFDSTHTTESQGKVTGLKDAVLNMLNKAVQSIVSGGSPSDSQTSNDSYQLLSSKCRSVLQCVPRSPMDQKIYKLLSCNSTNLLPFLAANSPWCGWDYCHASFESRSIGLPWQPEGFYASLFGGPSVLLALCHYLNPTMEGCDPTCWSMNHTLHQNGSVPQGEYINESLTDPHNITVADFPVKTESEPNKLSSPSILGEGQLSEEQYVQKPTVAVGTTDIPHEEQFDQPLINPTTSLPSQPSGNVVISLSQQQQQETQILPPTPVQMEDTPSSQANQYQSQMASGNQPQQKESVFVRLTNRIKNLERNQSLTASYLEELSKRFKKQNEDSNVIVESNKKSLNETKIRLLQLDSFYRQELHSMKRNMDNVRERLFSIQLQRSLLLVICLSQTLLIVVAFLWMKRKFVQFQTQLNVVLTSSTTAPVRELGLSQVIHDEKSRGSDPIITQEPLPLNSDSHGRSMMVGRKRSNSLSLPSEKSKKIKKKNKKQLIGGANSTNERKDNSTKFSSCNVPKPRSGEGLFDVPAQFVPKHSTSSAPLVIKKENIDPQSLIPNGKPLLNFSKSKSLSNSTNNSSTNSPTFQSISKTQPLPQPPSTLLTKVDSPFTFSQQISPFVDSRISTSSRFALLASPSRESPASLESKDRFFAAVTNSSLSSSIYQRSGSTESSVSTGSVHSESLSQSGSGSGGTTGGGWKGIFNGHASEAGKKGKNRLKSFMPKILFDR